MAQITHNISTPNDGLGDELRTAFNNQNEMNTDLYTNKVDKVVGKDLSTNDYDNDSFIKLAGIEEGAEVNVQSDWLQDDDTADDYIKNKPDQLFASVGYFDHNDLVTQTTPLTYTSGVELQLTNDTLGAFTTLDKAPYGITDIWDSTTNTFDLSSLDEGDTIDLRVDLNVSTVSATSTVKCFLRLAEGTANEYDVFIGSEYYKSAVTFENVKMDLSYYIGNEDVRITPAKLIFISDDTNGEVKVNGWYNRIIRRSINVVSVVSADTTFTDLTDTPSTYTGQAGKVATVNSAEDALEFDSFIPLTGTEADNPVTGDIELSESEKTLWIRGANYPDDYYSVSFSDGGIGVRYKNTVTNKEASLSVLENEIEIYANDGISGIGTSRGLKSSYYYGANYDDNTYVQKKYVDDAIAGGGGATQYSTPEEFGAVGDGTTDDTIAIQNAIDSGKSVLLGCKTYKVSSLTTSDSKGIFGLGEASVLYTESDATVINITGSRNTFKNFKILGNNTGTSQHGIKAIGVVALTTTLINNIIDGLYIFDLGGEGIGSEYMVGSSSGALHEGAFIVNNTVIDNCLYGVYLQTRAEYNVFSNTRIQNCTNGFFFAGGNNSFNGGAIVDCTYGVKSLSGSNDAHSQFSGTMINHNDYNVWTNHGSTYNFDGCTVYSGNIRVQGGTTQFTGCQISFGTGTSYVSTTAKAYFLDCQFATLPPTISGTNAAILKNCYFNGNVMTTIDKSYLRVNVKTSNFTFIIPKGTYIKNILIHNTTANEITGGLRIGTTSGGQEVVSDTPITANYINSLSLIKTAFSETADTTIYVQAVTSWNSASIRFIIDLDVFKI